MAQRDETVTTKSSKDETIAAGRDTLKSLGLKVHDAGPDTLEAKGGSKLITYWIGLIIPSSNMPVKVTYKVTDNGSNRTVNIHTKSSLFLALYTWKFKARVKEVTDGLLQGLNSRLATS